MPGGQLIKYDVFSGGAYCVVYLACTCRFTRFKSLLTASDAPIYPNNPTANIATRKRFSEKPIVPFTNNPVFIRDFCIYDKASSVSCFSLECLDLKKAHMVQET